MSTAIYEQLKSQLQQQSNLFNQDHATRLHRALSWYAAATDSDSDDGRFIYCWIAFSACYFLPQHQRLSNQSDFQRFVSQLVDSDTERRIYECIWQTFSGPVKSLIKNPYVFAPFWESQRQKNNDWKVVFDQSSVAALNCLSRGQVSELLIIIFDRLSVLHQQLVQGGATFHSSINRQQVKDGGDLLYELLPVIIEIMLLHMDDDWGELAYPVVSVD